jgi:hypothetical protein
MHISGGQLDHAKTRRWNLQTRNQEQSEPPVPEPPSAAVNYTMLACILYPSETLYSRRNPLSIIMPDELVNINTPSIRRSVLLGAALITKRIVRRALDNAHATATFSVRKRPTP